MKRGVFVIFEGETEDEAIADHFEGGYQNALHAIEVTNKYSDEGTKYKIIDSRAFDLEPCVSNWIEVPKKDK